MSSTRVRKDSGPTRQERYCSSTAYEHGLSGNVTSKRCHLLSPDEAELLLFVQKRSWEIRGGIKAIAEEMLAHHAGFLGTYSMRHTDKRNETNYTAEEVRRIRNEIFPGEIFSAGQHAFPLLDDEPLSNTDIRMILSTNRGHDFPDASDVENAPSSYPVSTMVNACRTAAEESLAGHLERICLDPEFEFNADALWYVDLEGMVKAYMVACVQEANHGLVATAIGERVTDSLDFALQEGGFVIVQGRGRIGKTFAAKHWCEQHPGVARYIQIPSSDDELALVRSFAKALGVGHSSTYKVSQIRTKIEEVIQRGDLMLVLDEAHYLWPQKARIKDAFPKRINWLMTAVLNHGVTCAAITTPQFTKTQEQVEQNTHWTSEQFHGRVTHFETLPDTMTVEDLVMIAETLLPDANPEIYGLLADYGIATCRFIAGVEAIAKRARYEAKGTPSIDLVFDVMQRSGRLPKALEQPAQKPKTKKTDRPTSSSLFQKPILQARCSIPAGSVQRQEPVYA